MKKSSLKTWTKRLLRTGVAAFCVIQAVAPAFLGYTTSTAHAAAGVPLILAHQGRLLDASGNLLGGSGTDFCFKFSLYDNATVGSGSKVWPSGSPSTMTASVRFGVYNVGIGDTTAGGDTLDYDFQTNDTVFLNIEVATLVGATCAAGDGAESFENLSPRQQIMSAGFAINSKTVGGFTPAQSASGSQIPALTSGNLILGGTNPQINASGANTLTLQSGLTGALQFFSSSNSLTSAGALTIAGAFDAGGVIQAGSGNVNITTSAGALDADALGLISSDGAGSTSSGSGLEVDTDRLGLLQGCGDGQVLAWSDSTNVWACSTAALTVREADASPSVAGTTTLEFGPGTASSDEFVVSDQTGGVTRIRIGDQVAMLNQGETVTGAWSFSGLTTHNANISLGTNTFAITTGTIGSNAATTIDFAEFDVAAATGSVTINDDGDAGAFVVEGTSLDINSLDFVGAGSVTSASGTALTLNPNGGEAAGEDLIITANNITLAATGALSITPDGALTTAIDLTDTDLTNALSIGDNVIVGTTANIDLTNFDVTGSSGDITTAGDIAINGDDITSDGDLTITPSGGDIILANGTTINIGGSGSDVAYNVIGDATTNASASLNSDDDLYIEGLVEADGGITSNTSNTTSSEAFGLSATSAGNFGASLGNSAAAGGTSSVAIGAFASAASSFAIAVGNSSSVGSAGTSSIVIGKNTTTNRSSTIVIGTTSTASEVATANNQLLIGTSDNAITSAFIGGGVTSTAPTSITFNATGGSGTDIAGGSLTLAGGIGTGAGAGGSLIFSTASAGASSSTANSLSTRMTIDSDGDITLSDSTTINIGGNGSDVAYNVIGDSTDGASAVNSDDDLYIEGGLEVDGTTTVADLAISTGTIGSNEATTIDFANFDVASTGTTTITQAVATSGSPTALIVTGAAHTTLDASVEAPDVNINLNRTVQFSAGALTTQRAVLIQAPTYAFTSASTISNAFTVEITGSPTAGTNATLTRKAGLRVLGGITTSGDGNGKEAFGLGANAATNGTLTTTVGSSTTASGSGAIAIGSSASAAGVGSIRIGLLGSSGHSGAIVLGNQAASTGANQFVVGGPTANLANISDTFIGNGVTATAPQNLVFNGTGGSGTNITGANLTFAAGKGTGSAAGGTISLQSTLAGTSGTTLGTLYTMATWNNLGNLTMTPGVATTGSPTHLTLTGAAHTTLTASTEAPDVNIDLDRTVQFATGALTTQRAFLVQAPTYAFVDASTLSTAATFAISGAPTAGTNATITTPLALWVQGGKSDFDGDVQANFSGTATTNGVCHSGANSDTTATDRDLVVCSGAPADLAEWYETSGNEEAGDIVSATEQLLSYTEDLFDPFTGMQTGQRDTFRSAVMEKTSATYQPTMFGVVSTSPYQVMGTAVKDSAAHPKPIAIIGRVPVKVTTENGAIMPGDAITSSSIAGVGMKATEPGMVIGYAVDSFDQAEQGKVMVFVRPGWFDGEQVQGNSDTSQIVISNTINEGDLDMQGHNILNISMLRGVDGKWSLDASGNLVVENVKTKTLTFEQTDTTQAVGEGEVLAGQSRVVVQNDLVKPNSRLAITFFGDIEGSWWIVRRTNGEFELGLSNPAPTTVKFEYIIIDVIDNRTAPAQDYISIEQAGSLMDSPDEVIGPPEETVTEEPATVVPEEAEEISSDSSTPEPTQEPTPEPISEPEPVPEQTPEPEVIEEVPQVTSEPTPEPELVPEPTPEITEPLPEPEPTV